MNSLINKSFYILTLVSALILLNGETAFSQQNDTSSSLITETISSVSSNLDSDYGPSYNLDNDSQVNSFLQELEISNELVYENMNQLGSVKEISNIDGDNEEVFYEDSSDNQTIELNEVKNEISNVLEELANDNVLSEEIIYEANKSIENDNSSENNFNDLKSESTISFASVSSTPIEEIKISSIGVDGQISDFPINAWGKIEIERASNLLEKINPNIDSKVIKKLIVNLVSSPLEPPIGNSVSDEEFLLLRMQFLANAGEIELLREFVDLLPVDNIFDLWREWRVQDAFLQGKINSDDLACKIVEEVSSNNIKEFWQMAHVFCMVIHGKEDEAIFNSELLKASGIKDENFFGLLDTMLGMVNAESFSINSESLNLLHVAMMDQVRNTIPPDYLLRTPYYINKTLINIDNIQPSSRAILLDNLVNLKLINEEKITLYYEEIGDPSAEFVNAISTKNGNLGPQSRADLWRAINNDDDSYLLNSKILKIIAIESKNGRSLQALKLYSPLLNSKMSKSVEESLAVRNLKTINSIVSSSNKENPSEDFYEKIIQEILNMESESELDLNVILKFDISETIPVLIENEKFDDQIDHLDKSLELEIKPKNYFITNPLLSLSLKSASDSKKLAEVLLISSMILNDYKLSEISSNDILEIIRALKKTGFERQAMDFTREWLACKLVKKISEPYLKK